MVVVTGITETTQRQAAAVAASCPGVITMDHLIMVGVTVVTHLTMTGARITIVIEIAIRSQICERLGIHARPRTEIEIQGTHETSGTEMAVTMTTGGM
jgi:hypothetical protein